MKTVPPRTNPIYLTAAANKGISWKKVLRTTPQERFASAEQVRISKVKVTRKAGVITGVSCESRSKDAKYITVFEFPNPDDPDIRKMSCNCSDFVFRWEYALYRRGGSDINYGDGTAPIKTNPSLTLGVCKHLVAADWLIQEKRLF